MESLIEHPALMTHASLPKVRRGKIGISDGLVRLSVGLDSLDDLIGDIDQALQSLILSHEEKEYALSFVIHFIFS